MIDLQFLLLLIISVSASIQLINYFRSFRRRRINPYECSEKRVETLETLANSISLITASGGNSVDKIRECIELEIELIKKAQEALQNKEE